MTLDMKALARLGAQARLAELVAEMDALLREFPGLADSKAPAQEVASTEKAPERKARKRRKKLTKEQRKAASARMKAYWEKKKG